MGQIFVKVRNLERDSNGQKSINYDQESVITYNAYKIIGKAFNAQGAEVTRFELLYQCDEQGNQIEGNPNLEAHLRQVVQRVSVAPVVSDGPSKREIELQAEIERLKAQQVVQLEVKVPDTPIIERKKPGPKPKQSLQTEPA